MSHSISVDVVLNNGAIDSSATIEAFEAALEDYTTQFNAENGAIGDAVAAVFAANPGKRIVLPTVGNLAAVQMNATPENFAALAELAKDYVRRNSVGDSSLFVMGKGPREGGVALRADLALAAK
jgi:hypothetical protein